VASKRRQILSALKSAIDDITTANGYNNDLQGNYLDFVMYDAVKSYPAVTYIVGDSDYSPLAYGQNAQYAAGSGYNSVDGWDISVIGYVKADRDTSFSGTLSTAIEDLIEDILKAVLGDHTLGLSFVQNIYLVRILRDTVDEMHGICQIDFEVKYDFTIDAP